MRILISHSTYPSQFRRLAPALVAAGHEVVFLHQGREWHAPDPQGVKLVGYAAARSKDPEHCHPYLRRLETAVCQGQAAYRAARTLDHEGFQPDVILSHAGFGAGLYLGDAFPQAKRISLFEWYYNAFGSDVDFLQKGVVEADRQLRLRTWNAQLLLELADCDAAVVPTNWQRQQFPEALRSQLTLIHEGVDVERLVALRIHKPAPPPWLPQGNGVEVVSYVSRGFEAYRGFPQAMEALALLQQQRPMAHVCIAGNDSVCYGQERSDGRSWGQWAKDCCGLDPARTHWLGALGTEDYHGLLAYSQAHLYLTIPFVLSWSLLEAMAAGCAITASATAPVEELISTEREGLLADFWDPKAIASQLNRLLGDSALAEALGERAQAKVAPYSAAAGLEGWAALMATLQ
ncbi:glycosyl transferase/ family 1 [Synechococcus sp. PROS-7-1]|uniref:glycosyltransferase n=1 Tax=Synechococcus sp. PROS-7-1 TaxID=1442556 RepID=UPI0016440C94|nr:glycosyltransferase [Synechococcus sp. PROS-7-1]QNI83976.1 glycosyl transferase/ family 1 [Synechococcus sp. PROS-7-1]